LHAESSFDFLNRVAGDYWDQPRALVEEWAMNLKGDGDYQQTRKAIRSGIDDQFRSALLELYLHEVFIRGGFDIEIHPAVTGTNRRPDFRLTRGESRFYLEAISPGTRPETHARSQRESVVLDLLNAMPSPNFLLSLRGFESGPHPLKTRALRAKLSGWLATLDPDAHEMESGPEFTWSVGGWSITVQAIPKRKDARGQLGRAIGIYAASGGVVKDASILRAAIGVKDKAYGTLDAPFVIAVGTYFWGSTERETAMAFYGSDGLRLNSNSDRADRVRETDGYFGAPSSWRHHNVSAVLTVNQLMPWTASSVQPVLWRHPDAAHPIGGLGVPFVEMVAGEHEVDEVYPMSSVSKFLGLPDPWPSGDPWPRDDA
jgi:hypothetical protein